MMRHTPWWIAAAFAASVGCDGTATNPNEVDFPGAPGSRVAAPKAVEVEGGGGGGMSQGNGAGLPSNYPGLEKFREGAPKDDNPKDKPEEAEAPATKPDAGAAPGTEPKGTPKPAEPKTDAPPTPGR